MNKLIALYFNFDNTFINRKKAFFYPETCFPHLAFIADVLQALSEAVGMPNVEGNLAIKLYVLTWFCKDNFFPG